MKSKVNLQQLKWEIEHMHRWDEIFLFLRDELSKVDHWKYRKRGDPIKGYFTKEKNKEDKNENAE